MSDQEVITKVLAGDKASFEVIILTYQKPILFYLMRLLNFNQHDAEDALSETFLKVYVNLASYNPSLKFSSWLYRIAHNEGVNIIRQKSKTYSVDIDLLDIPANIDFNKPSKTDLEKILNKLKEEDKNILILYYLEDKSLKEISEILKISENNATVRLKRARDKAKNLTK